MSIKRTYESAAGIRFTLWQNDDGSWPVDQVKLALLMDVREELKTLNRLLGCRNVATGFRALTRIARLNEATFERRVRRAVAKKVKETRR